MSHLSMLFLFSCLAYTYSFTPILKQLNYSELYSFNVNSSVEYILNFSNPSSYFQKQIHLPPRVTIISNNATTSFPLMIVTRQTRELLSWQLPLIVESDSGRKVFNETSRTLCYHISRHNSGQHVLNDNPVVTVSTSSDINVNFSVEVEFQEHFYIAPSIQYNFSITPSQPKFFFYNFTNNATKDVRDSDYDTVVLEVSSNDSVCMTVSIQNISCPVFDLNEDITFRGFYETVSTKGGITIPKYKFPFGFYVVFVANADDSKCTGHEGLDDSDRIKNISLTIKPNITYNDFINAVIITLSCIGAFYLVFGVAFFFCSVKTYIPRQMEYVTPTTSEAPTICGNDNISDEFDTVPDAESERIIRLGKSNLYLSDLAQKDPRIHKYRSYLYLYNALTIAVFYGLPVIQLVVTYQTVLNNTGQQDLCYYNFLCAHPAGVLSDFNHVFSNIAYILLGILFIWITFRRESQHKDLNFDRAYGIPQHYGMFYAMGVALIMEGVLSGSYHVCPNAGNFQFDSSFMYVMAVLCMVKLYQNRHPDINAPAYGTFGVLSVSILIGVIGIFEANLYFWIVFTVIYLMMCCYVSVKIYYLGCWTFNASVFRRVYNTCRNDFISGPLNLLKPTYKARFILLLIGNVCNWALAIFGLYRHENDFGLFLLVIFMSNTLLYFFFYIIMKYVNKEHVNTITWLFLCLSILCAISAMWFFIHKSISWSKTPAESRQFNQECKLLRFYDYHDIWHFLSAIGMFFTFMVLLTLDDDLSHKHRSEIIVF